LITDYSEIFKKRDKLRFAEINTKSDGTHLSTSIWDGIELKEMLWHTTRGRKTTREIFNIINRIILGEEFSFKNGDIISTFRTATVEDLKRAEEDVIILEKEFADIELPPHIKNIEADLLKKLNLNNKNN
jgi:hypothetical protein